MTTAIIIQARVDSTRLPNKVLKLIKGKPMLWHIIERCKKTHIPVIVATTNRKKDDPIVKISRKCKVNFFRGKTNDALDRYYQTAKKYSIKYIIRVTGDNPFIDPKLCLRVQSYLKKKKFNYILLGPGYPKGMGVEGFTFSTLEKSWKKSTNKFEREHVSQFMQYKKNNFKILIIKNKKNLENLRWTVDYIEDLKFVRKIYSEFPSKKIFSMNDILVLLKKKPQLSIINKNII